MPWPTLSNYAEAIRDYPHISILDSKLKGGNPQRGANNYLMVYSGGFSGVFPIEVLSNTYALRCWTRDIGDAETRYKEISDYLKQYRLPYFVDFAYVSEGILVNGIRYPITRMEWAEGNTLCDFIEHNLQDARCLKTAAAEFQKMVAALHAHQISHGDLQDGNILLKRSGTDVEIKLIDYDSLFVPALRGQPDTIVGVPAYQHPQRIARGVSAAEKMDYFSELVIYLSLSSLAEKPDLWNQFGAPTERRLLFIAEDFKDPDQSDVFRELENLSADVKHLASKLKEFCQQSVDQLEPLEAVLPKTSPAQVAYNQGIAYLNNNRYNEAVGEFKKAIGLDPNYKEAHHGLGLAHLKMNNPREAKRAAEAALGIDPHYQPAHQLLDAVKSFKPPPVSPPPPPPAPPKPTTSNPWQYITGALAFVLLICIVVLATQIREKDEYLNRIEILENQQTETHSKLIAASNEKRQLSFENRRLRNQLAEKDKEIKNQISTVQQLQSEKEEFRSQNQKLENENTTLRNQLKLDGTTSSIRALSTKNEQLLRENQRLQDQLTAQDKEIKHKTTIAEQLQNEKEDLLNQNQTLQNEKEEFLSQRRQLQNENAMLREQLDEQKPIRPPPDDSEQAAPLQKIYRNISPEVKSGALSKNNQGYFDFNKGKYDDAIKYFENAIKSDPKAAIIYYNLGSTYLKMKEYTKAVNYLQKAVKLDPEFKEAHYNLALALGKGTVK